MGKKSELTKERILKSALHCISKYGDRATTFQKIADHCGVSQTLVVKYFKTREDIFPAVLAYFFHLGRQKTQESLSFSGTAEQKLKNYLSVSVQIFRSEIEFSNVYLTFYYLSGFDEKYRKINEDAKQIAIKRITDILNEGVANASFKVKNINQTAKIIHNSLTGLLLNLATESGSFSDQTLLNTLGELLIDSLNS